MLQIVRQNEVAKKVENALKDAGLSSRDVTPFLKVRVMGLISKHSATKSGHREGLITIWNPTEKQVRYNNSTAYKCQKSSLFFVMNRKKEQKIWCYVIKKTSQ